MTIVLDEHFTGTSVNTSTWTNIYGGVAWLPNGTAGSHYNPVNVTVNNGLHLAIKRENYQGYHYTCGGLGGLISQYQISQGRWEVKAKFPSCGSDKGVVGYVLLWPANGDWPPEIDFAETTGSDANKIICTQHWGSSSNPQAKTDSFSLDTTLLHIYTVDVWNNQVKFYIDNILKSTQTQNFTTTKFGLSIGTWTGACSGYGGCPTNTTMPQSMDIEYVKIYNDASTPPGPIPITKYSCSGAPNYTCAADPNGQYNTLAECQAACKNPNPSNSRFNIYQLGQDGVTVTKSANGTNTAAQAIQTVSNILNTLNISGIRVNNINKNDSMTTKITEMITNSKMLLIDKLVKIEKLDVEENGIIYLMKIADIPIRPYITYIEANRVANYMKKIVNAIIQKIDQNKDLTGKDLVKIEQLSTKEGTFYLMTIADVHLRCYIEGFETLVHKNFMVEMVNEIIKQSSGQ